MKPDFDEIIDRKNTNCLKYDFAASYGKPEGIMPLWIADMDFRTSEHVIAALTKACQHGIFGYSEGTESYYASVQQWFACRHNWQTKKEWIVKTPGVVYAMCTAIRALTEKGDAILIQPPVYPPFFHSVLDNDRVLITNPLICKNNRYEMDLDDFENKIIKHKIKLFMFCSPQNPTGRVWTPEELTKMADICLKHGVIIFSDDIHADFTYTGHTHHFLAGLKPAYQDITITCTAPSKTFNLPGLQVSNIFIPNAELREAFRKEINRTGYSQLNSLGLAACEAAYKEGGPWLDALLEYLQGNLHYLKSFLKDNIPQIKPVETEGTYLAWLDCSGLNFKDQKELDDFMVNKANLWLNSGTSFGSEGLHFQRLNFACPRITLEKALSNLKKAVKTL